MPKHFKHQYSLGPIPSPLSFLTIIEIDGCSYTAILTFSSITHRHVQLIIGVYIINNSLLVNYYLFDNLMLEKPPTPRSTNISLLGRQLRSTYII